MGSTLQGGYLRKTCTMFRYAFYLGYVNVSHVILQSKASSSSQRSSVVSTDSADFFTEGTTSEPPSGATSPKITKKPGKFQILHFEISVCCVVIEAMSYRSVHWCMPQVSPVRVASEADLSLPMHYSFISIAGACQLFYSRKIERKVFDRPTFGKTT